MEGAGLLWRLPSAALQRCVPERLLAPAPPSPGPLQGLPEDAREGDLQALLAPVAGLREVRLPRDRGSGRPKGYAFLVRWGVGARCLLAQGAASAGADARFPSPLHHHAALRALQEFDSVQAAAALMGSDWREQTFFGPHRLRYEFARARPAEAGAADWACEPCGAANFARCAGGLWKQGGDQPQGVSACSMPGTTHHPPPRPAPPRPVTQAHRVLPVRARPHPRRAPAAGAGGRAALLHPAGGGAGAGGG